MWRSLVSECSLSYAGGMTPRAPRLRPEERRAAILAAAVPVLIENGRGTTTKQVAEAAGIAEGTIFRSFATKEDLVDAALDAVFDPTAFLAELASIERDQPLRDRLVAIAMTFQRRFSTMFRLMAALGIPPPAAKHRGTQIEDWKEQAGRLMVEVIGADADRLRVPADQVAHVIRLLTFSASHPHIAEGGHLTPEEIVDVVLTGTLRQEPPC